MERANCTTFVSDFAVTFVRECVISCKKSEEQCFHFILLIYEYPGGPRVLEREVVGFIDAIITEKSQLYDVI